jgi:hypothetical protein
VQPPAQLLVVYLNLIFLTPWLGYPLIAPAKSMGETEGERSNRFLLVLIVILIYLGAIATIPAAKKQYIVNLIIINHI